MTLIVLGGLPGTGKTTIARMLAERLGAVYVRIDTIEQALRGCGTLAAGVVTEGYMVGYAVAEDNLRTGLIVIAECVNPLAVTRDSWVAMAERSGVPAIEVEVICSDATEHRRRVESRRTDISGLVLPTWDAVERRDYEPWNRPRVVVDTAVHTPATAVDLLCAKLVAARD